MLTISLAYCHEIQEFIQWFNENGGIASDHLTIADNIEGMGRGLVAINEIATKEKILVVPYNLTFSLAAIRLKSSVDKTYDAIATKVPQSSSDLAVTLSLLYEKYKGDESSMRPYIQVLPSYVPNLSYFTDDEIEQIQQADLYHSIKSYRRTLEKSYADLVDVAKEIFDDGMFSQLTFEDFLWAASIIDSRGLRFQGKVFLAAFADMFNYKSLDDNREQNAGETFLTFHENDPENREIRIFADRNHAKGEQIFEDYGDNPDSLYLMHHGFVPDYNPFRCVKLVGPNKVTLPSKVRAFVGSLRYQGPPSSCIRDDNYLGQFMQVYFAAISFNNSEIKKCMKKTNVSEPMWDDVLESCGFNRVSQFLHDVTIRNSVNIIHFPTPNQHPILNNRLNLDDEQYQAVNDNSESIERRTLETIQHWLETISPTYSTSLQGDIDEYHNVQKSNANDKKSIHYSLALKYRIHQKVAWANLCIVYSAECSVLKPDDDDDDDSNDNSQDLEEEEQSVGPDIIQDDVDPNAMTLSDKLNRFNDWFQEAVDAAYGTNHLKAVEIDNYRIGTIATKDIDAEEIYLQVPMSVILDSKKAQASNHIWPLLKDLNMKYGRSDEYHELIFFLLYEKFVLGSESDFWPYISLLPSEIDLIDIPLYWPADEIYDRLYPSFLTQSVNHYRDRVLRMYEFIIAEESIKEFFPPKVLTFDNYRWAVTILDSRSIWWNQKRHLVPMLDFVNCQELETNRSRVHSTTLSSSGKFADTKAGKHSNAFMYPFLLISLSTGQSFKLGHQVFENYGQPNLVYFQYHGFSLVASNGTNMNSHDCVHFEITISPEEGKKIDQKSPIASQLVKVI